MHRRSEIDRHLASSLSAEREKRLRDHLRSCDLCRAYYDAQVELLRALSGDAGTPAAAELERVVARAVEGTFESLQPAPNRLATSWIDRFVWISVQQAVSVMLVIVLGRGTLAWWFVAGSSPVGKIAMAKSTSLEGQQLNPGVDGVGLKEGQRVVVGKKGLARLNLNRGGSLRLFPNTDLLVTDGGNRVVLSSGSVWCKVKRGRGEFEVLTSSARVRVLGTSFVVEHQPKGRTDVWVVEGEVEVSGLTDGKSVRLTQRQRTHLGPKTPPAKPRSYRPSEMSEWDKILEGLEGAVDEFKDLFR